MTANRGTARNLVWASRLDDDTPHPAARDVLEAVGVIDPGGRDILPDDERPLLAMIPAPGKVPTAAGPPAKATTTPPGLKRLPPPAPPKAARKPRAVPASRAQPRKRQKVPRAPEAPEAAGLKPEWLGSAQRSPRPAVHRRAHVAIAALLQLRCALDDLARAERCPR